MFIEERHQAILDIIAAKGKITTKDIQTNYQVSYDSAKRDLRILQEKGLLKRTHGGAIANRNIGWSGGCHDALSRERVPNVKENYLEIAKRAVKMIEPDDVVYLTHASIGFLMVKNIPLGLRCTIVTNSISIADELRKFENISVILTGGEMSHNGSFYDGFALDIIKRLKFDKSFITSACISAEFGLSIQKPRNIEFINTVIANSKSVIGLYPTEKIGFDSIISICPSNKLDILVTDWDASEEDLKTFDEQEIEIIVADK